MQLHAQFRTAREVCERRGRAPPASAALPPVESEGCANSARSRTGASLLRCKELVARKFAARKEAAKWGKYLSEALRDASTIAAKQQHSCRRTFFGTVVLK
jgi:hypothetical protein